MNEKLNKNAGFKAAGLRMIILSMFSWAIFSFTCMNAYGVWVPAVADKVGVDFADLNMWNTYGGLVAAIATFIAAHIVRRAGSRKTLLVTLALCGLNFWLIPFFPTAIIGVGVALNAILQVFYGNMSTTVLMKNWYPRKNAVVMGWVTTGVAVGGIAMLPLFNNVLHSKGVIFAMAAFGISFIIIGIIDFIFIKDEPEMLGFDPDGMPMTEEERKIHMGTKKERNPWTLKKVFTNSRMLAISIGWGVENLALSGALSCAIPIMISKGVAQERAVAIAAIGSILAIFGSVISGIVADRIGTKRASMLFVFIQLLSALITAFAGQGQVALVILGYVLLVTMSGSPSNLIATSVLHLTGARFFTVAWGTIFMVINLLRAFGSSVISFSLKNSGGYNTALFIFSALLVVSILLINYAGEDYQDPGIEVEDTDEENSAGKPDTI